MLLFNSLVATGKRLRDLAGAVDEALHHRLGTRFFSVAIPIGPLTIGNSTGQFFYERMLVGLLLAALILTCTPPR